MASKRARTHYSIHHWILVLFRWWRKILLWVFVVVRFLSFCHRAQTFGYFLVGNTWLLSLSTIHCFEGFSSEFCCSIHIWAVALLFAICLTTKFQMIFQKITNTKVNSQLPTYNSWNAKCKEPKWYTTQINRRGRHF